MTADVLNREVPPQVAALRRSPLADHAGLAAMAAPGGGLRVVELPFLTQVNLRVDPQGPAAARVAERLGVALPMRPNTVAVAGARSVLWLGPDEWLVVGPDGDLPDLVPLLTGSLAGDPGAVVDVSSNRTTIEVSGPDARGLLEKGVAIDLHPRSFGAGRCAQTLLARAQVVLWQVTDAPSYRVLVRGSFAGYLADWLVDAADEYLAPEDFAS